jgi:hypothetical protein
MSPCVFVHVVVVVVVLVRWPNSQAAKLIYQLKHAWAEEAEAGSAVGRGKEAAAMVFESPCCSLR